MGTSLGTTSRSPLPLNPTRETSERRIVDVVDNPRQGAGGKASARPAQPEHILIVWLSCACNDSAIETQTAIVSPACITSGPLSVDHATVSTAARWLTSRKAASADDLAIPTNAYRDIKQPIGHQSAGRRRTCHLLLGTIRGGSVSCGERAVSGNSSSLVDGAD
jgi:hypothetical protein